MEKMKIWYDEEGDYLEIGFGKKKGYMKDIGDDMWERIEEGKVTGISILKFRKRLKKGRTEVKLPVELSFKEAAGR